MNNPINNPIWEEVQPTYFAPETYKVAPPSFRRVNHKGKRFYDDQNGNRYISLTSFLDAVVPAPKQLRTWREEVMLMLGSSDKLEKYMGILADFGTCAHILLGEFTKNGHLTTEAFDDQVNAFIIAQGIDPQSKLGGMIYEAQLKTLASFMQFLYDKEAQILAVEIPCCCPNFRVATQIDLVVEMKFNKSAVTAAINLKTGLNPSKFHELQLAMEKYLYEQTYKGLGLSLDMIFGLHPSDWKEKPTYTLKNYSATYEANIKALKHFWQAAQLTTDLFEMQSSFVRHDVQAFVLGQDPSTFFKVEKI